MRKETLNRNLRDGKEVVDSDSQGVFTLWWCAPEGVSIGADPGPDHAERPGREC